MALHPAYKHWFMRTPNGRIGITDKYSYLFSYGGRGGGKTDFLCEALPLIGTQEPVKILCVREFQNSIDDSVIAGLLEKMDEHFPNFYRRVGNEIRGKNGTLFSFRGIGRNTLSLKSLKGYKYCWVEEGDAISAFSWDILDPTIRLADSVMIISMNRNNEDSVLDRLFIQNEPPPRTNIVKVNYTDNPFPIPKLIEKAEHCRKVNFKAYQHIWLGELNKIDEAEVFHGKWRTEKFETPEDAIFYHGVDWGFGAHPTAIVRCYIKENTLYIDKAGYYWRSDLEDLPELFIKDVPTSKTWRIIADSANPAEIRYIRNKGFDVWGVKKGTIESGIRYLRSYDCIVIHE
ncbi:MAG: PBSX family phage terminase large subunit, partial [Desulfobulbaceae bacterium]|nr:PBSX family phage terminase large subunit [Desulfobulbaceae bacterium]